MDTRLEEEPAGVSAGTKQVGEVEARRERWAWAEPSVWTDRMLAALENGVQGGRWFSLIDKVYREENLRSAFDKVKRNRGAGGVDWVTVEKFETDLDRELTKLSGELKAGTYTPQAARRAYIGKAGSREKRPLGIPTVRDRISEGALRQVLEPIFEREFADNSHGFRPKRSAKDALREVDNGLKDGKGYVVEADIQRYFDTIPHERLLARIAERIADGRVMELLGQMLKRGVLEDREWKSTETGTPQGGVISPLLANVYLNPLDHEMQKAGYTLIRYADDLVIAFERQDDAERVMAVLGRRMGRYGLTLHPDKTRLLPFGRPAATAPGRKGPATFDFLGFTFFWGKSRWGKWWVQCKTRCARLRRTMVSIAEWCRSHRHYSVKVQHAALTRRLRGHFNYFGVSGNGRSLRRLVYAVKRSWFKWLQRRSQRRHLTWEKFSVMYARYPLPSPRITVRIWAT